MFMGISVWEPQSRPAMACEARTLRRRLSFAFLRLLMAMWLLPIGLVAMPLQGAAEDFFDKVVIGRPTVDLAVGEGRILRFDGPVDSVFVADSSVADVRVVSADVVYVYGKKSGATNLIATSAEQRVRVQVQLRVAINAQPANDAMHKLQRTSTVEISI